MSSTKTLPRVIDGEGIREGQIIATHTYGENARIPVVTAGKIIAVEHHPAREVGLPGLPLTFPKSVHFCVLREGGLEEWWDAETFPEIVLLADAPEPELTPGQWRATKDAVLNRVRPCNLTWRGAPITPQSIRKNDLYDIHTAQGTTITGILAGRNGIYRPQSGDQYRLVHRGA